MAFSLSGTIITQSGTDADISGLSGIAGVDAVLAGGKTWYYTNDLQIVISGDVTFDPRYEAIVTGDLATANKTIHVTGSLTMGVPIIVNGLTRYTEDLGIYIGRDMGTSTQGFQDGSQSGLYVANNATFNWNGGTINIARAVGFMASATVVIRSGVLDMSRATATNNVQLRYRCPVDIIGLKVFGSKTTWITTTVTTLSGYEPIQMIEPLVMAGQDGNNFFEVEGYAGEGCERDGTFLNQNIIATRFINPVRGSGLEISGHLDSSGTNRDGTVDIESDFKIVLAAPDGSPVVGGKVFIKDVDNGSRKNRTTNRSHEYITDRDFLGTTDAAGSVADRKLIMAMVSNNYVDVTPDRRTTSNDATDTDIVNAYAYGYNPALITHSHTGAGVKTTASKLIANTATTESDMAVVATYTDCNTSEMFKDLADAFLLEQWSVYFDFIVLRSGDTIDAGSFDVVLDSNAASAFSFDGSTITIKADEFTGSIVTTGIVTLVNDASVAGSITDSTGTRTRISFTGVQDDTEIRLYDAAGVEIGTGVENSSGGIVTIPYNHTGTDISVRAIIISLGYQNQVVEGILLTEVASSIPVSQVVDRQYRND